jgi:hypothetical protein
VGGGEIVIPMPEALSFAESRRQKYNLCNSICMYLIGDIITKCEQYWPDNVHGVLVFGRMEVETVEVMDSNISDVLIRKLKIKSI